MILKNKMLIARWHESDVYKGYYYLFTIIGGQHLATIGKNINSNLFILTFYEADIGQIYPRYNKCKEELFKLAKEVLKDKAKIVDGKLAVML